MHRQSLLQLLADYDTTDVAELRMLTETIAFVGTQADCFHRTLLTGHVTGSAWIVSPDRARVVLIHHRKLDRWLQPGGHADGDPDVAAVALREAQEETGLTSLRLVTPAIFDVDVHTIPARDNEPAHQHYDIRFLLEADPAEPFVQTIETKSIKWVPITEVRNFTNSDSILRMTMKKMQFN